VINGEIHNLTATYHILQQVRFKSKTDSKYFYEDPEIQNKTSQIKNKNV
jgi:hypothetical protein